MLGLKLGKSLKWIVGAGGVVVLGWVFGMVSGIFDRPWVQAKGADFNVDIDNILTITLDKTKTTATGTTNTFLRGSVNVGVASNNITGVNVTMTTGKNTAEPYATDLKHTVIDATIASLSSDTTRGNFPTGRWGYSLDDTTEGNDASLYRPVVPLDSAVPITIISSNVATNVSQDVYFGARVDATKSSGVYYNTMMILAVTNHVPRTLADAYDLHGKNKYITPEGNFYAMQDMTTDICNDTEVIGSSLRAVDLRDNKNYWITKLKMNRGGTETACWMTQNLDLDLNTAHTLTYNNTDIGHGVVNPDPSATWTPTDSTIPTSTASPNPDGAIPVTGWSYTNTAPKSYNHGDVYYYTSNAISSDIEYDSLSACIVAGHTIGECKHYHVGNHYNWTAAVAMNDSSTYTTSYQNVDQSICPAGWRLPIGMTGDNTASEFARLMYANEITDTLANSMGQSLTFLNNGANVVRQFPFWSTQGGIIGVVASDNTIKFLAKDGNYYSSSVSSVGGAYRMDLTPSSNRLAPQDGYYREAGCSLRCLAR